MRSLVAITALATMSACVDQGPGPQGKRIEPGYVPKHLLQQAPVRSRALDVAIGGKVVYLGNNVSTTRLIPGQPFKITHYWQVVAPPGPGFEVFTLLRGEPNTADFMNLAPTDMQRAHPPATWKAGEIIEDEQELVLRPDWRSTSATLSVGLIARGAHGVGDRMAATGPDVKDRAVIARVFEVDTSKAPPPPGTVHVPFATGEIVIDGSANEIAWATAAASSDFLTAEGSPEPPGKATAKLTWDETNLYVYVNVVDPDIYSEFKNQDDPLWKADAVELFIDADGNRRGYVELQVNPNNASFDAWFPNGRSGKSEPEWDSGLVSAVKVRNTPDIAGDADQGWEVELAIPWAAIKGRDEAMQVKLPPQVGDRWRMNVVRVDKRAGSPNPAASSWNRITYQDWHGLDRLLVVVFADTKGGVVPGSVTRPGAPAAPTPTPTEPGTPPTGAAPVQPAPAMVPAQRARLVAPDVRETAGSANPAAERVPPASTGSAAPR